jgi:hypothetical protein
VEPNQMKLGFLITNNKASYVAKGDSICLFSVAKEMALNKQRIKPCVPFSKSIFDKTKKKKVYW